MVNTPVRIFVSHHHSPDEDAFTAHLVADLTAAGADVWVDTSGIPSGSFVAKISEGLEGRQWLLLVMTPAALTSSWVRAEVEAALQEVNAQRMLGVVPLMMQSCRDQDMPVLWRTLQRYDATRDYQGAISGLLLALGLASPAAAGRPPVPPPSVPAKLSISPDWFPPQLASHGFEARIINGVEVILPPLCDVPAGEFLMGSTLWQARGQFGMGYRERPQNRVTLPDFQIARYPVTVAEYACFVRSGYAAPQRWENQVKLEAWQAQLQRLDHPVVYVSWNDAVAYAAWLAKQTGQLWRLQTEAEWEKAARGTDGRIYPWGDSFDKTRCNTMEGGKGETTPVGSYPSGASPYGVQDMAGNVSEWTSSLFKYYPYRVSDDRDAQNAPGLRALRGGSWSYNAKSVRATYRIDSSPDHASGNTGFRLARSR